MMNPEVWKVSLSGADWDWSYSETVCLTEDKELATKIVEFLLKKLPDLQVRMTKVETVSSFRAFKRDVWHPQFKDRL